MNEEVAFKGHRKGSRARKKKKTINHKEKRFRKIPRTCLLLFPISFARTHLAFTSSFFLYVFAPFSLSVFLIFVPFDDTPSHTHTWTLRFRPT